MTEEAIVAPEPAATEAPVEPVKEEAAPEAVENTEGQIGDQPASEGETPKEEDRTESQKRRDRRKEAMKRLRDEADAAEAALQATTARQEAIRKRAEESSTPPKEADFQDYNEYLIAVGAFTASKSMDTRAAEEAGETAKAEQARLDGVREQQKAELAQGWAEQVADASGRYADFEKVAYTAPISDELAQFVMASDMGADIAYHLGTERELAAQLSSMPLVEAAREIGRIEARLSLPKANVQPSAPDPVTPVRPSPTGVKSPDKMSMAEYKAARAAGKI
ncbi:MAG: hypothetical protein ACPGSI_18945 [Pikeienuella sp.]